MGNSYSADNIADDHIHTDMTCNIEEPKQKYRLGTVSYRLLGWGEGLNKFYWIQTHENKQITNKAYDEGKFYIERPWVSGKSFLNQPWSYGQYNYHARV